MFCHSYYIYSHFVNKTANNVLKLHTNDLFCIQVSYLILFIINSNCMYQNTNTYTILCLKKWFTFCTFWKWKSGTEVLITFLEKFSVKEQFPSHISTSRLNGTLHLLKTLSQPLITKKAMIHISYRFLIWPIISWWR